MEIYEAYRYAANGHSGEVGDGEIIARGSLDECRRAVADRILGARDLFGPIPDLGLLFWSGTDDDIEAYHESTAEGCGGWAIRRATTQ